MSELRLDPDLSLLRGAYRDLQDPGVKGCPPPDALVALAVGERDAESERVADHVVDCRRCSDDMQLLLRTHAETSAGQTHRALARSWLFVAAAAAIAIAIGVFLLARRPSLGPSESVGVERGGATDYGILVTPHGGAALDRAPEEFVWPPQTGAASYRVRLFDRSGDALWQAEATTASRVSLPSSVRDRLRSGESYFWTVEVDLASDSRRLGPFPFTMR